MSRATLAKPGMGLYEEDFNLWLEKQAGYLQESRLDALDAENLAEELHGEIRAVRRLAEATVRLLVLGKFLAGDPTRWWQPYLESLALHYTSDLPPTRLAPFLDEEASTASAADFRALERELNGLLEATIARHPSLAFHLAERLFDIVLEAQELVAQRSDVTHTAPDLPTLRDLVHYPHKALGALLVRDPESFAYRRDRYQWLKQQVLFLKTRAYGKLDTSHLIKEVDAISKRDRRALENRLVVLLAHLLKYGYQQDQRSRSWIGTIREQRRRIGQILDDSPSLRGHFRSYLPEAYRAARYKAQSDTGLPLESFPDVCPYALEQVLNEDFLPD